MAKSKYEFHPLTPDRWDDFATLFGARGACGGCWCMAWRLTSAQFEKQKGAANRQAMQALVAANARPGILAYAAGQPVGWCSVAPRATFMRLQSSRVLKPVDEAPVWSVSCFFIAKAQRKQGLSVKLLEAAIAFVKARGGRIVEGYPTATAKQQVDTFMWTGLEAAFIKAGFKEVARRSMARPIMRYQIK